MGFLNDWFGTGKITRDIGKELALIESVIDDLSDIDKIINETGLRGKKLERILALEKKAVSKGLSIEHKLEAELQPYIEGKKKTDDLARILLLNRLLRDFREDNLWKELFELWKSEQLLLKEGNSLKIRKNLEEQKHIAMLLKKLITFEYNETHIHFGMSVGVDVHWKYLKRLWKREKKKGEKTLLEMYQNLVAGDKMFVEDLQTIKMMMSNYFSGKWTESKSIIEFEKLLFMLPQHMGSFNEFNKKCNILNPIQDCMLPVKSRQQRQYILENLESIARHNIANKVMHIEIRYPCATREGIEIFASAAEEIEERFENKISIRYVEFMIGNYDAKRFFAMYNALPKNLKKYLVAIDMVGGMDENKEAIALARKSGLPVCIHAGEVFSQRDRPDKSKSENVEISLRQVERALSLPNIHRLGHAIVIGIDLDEYLKGEPISDIKRLKDYQMKLIKVIKKKNVYVEANPTSNVMIKGLTYYEHPISEFSNKGINFSISTDDRIIFDTNLRKEYYRIARALRWTEEQLEEANRMSREAMLK